MTLPRIVVDVNATGFGTITIDGIEVRGVRTVEVLSTANDIQTVRLTILSEDVEYRGKRERKEDR